MRESRAVMTWMARLIRDSSPPDATFASGRTGWPGLALTRNSIPSSPVAAGVSDSSGSTATSKRPPSMPRVCMLSVTASPSFFAARRRPLPSFSASFR